MRPRHQRSGAALLTVLVAMMLMSLMLFEFQYQAMVERRLAYNELAQLQAYYLAKSGARIGLLRVALFGRALRSPLFRSIPGGAAAIRPFLEMIWSLPLPPFPPIAQAKDKMLKADRDNADKVLKQTKVKEGESTHVISSEGGKINLNDLVIPERFRDQRTNFTGPMRGAFDYTARLLYFYLENLIRESDDPAQEYGNMRPEEVVYNIIDWVTPGDYAYGGGNKDQFYEQQDPPYRAKRNRFYSLEELRLVKGIDDFLFEKLRGKVTVYSYSGKINLNSADRVVMKAIYPDFTEDDLNRLFEFRDRNPGGWVSESQFVQFVSETLGRAGFKQLYNDPQNYPFTVSSDAFVIEAMGKIQRSKSSVQRIIRVGVALTGPGIGAGPVQPLPQADAASCQAAQGQFFPQTFPSCWPRPATMSKEVCDRYSPPFFWNGSDCRPTGPDNYTPLQPLNPGGGGAAGGGNTATEPQGMKILYWRES
jgi:type II secretory pathway component PulK